MLYFARDVGLIASMPAKGIFETYYVLNTRWIHLHLLIEWHWFSYLHSLWIVAFDILYVILVTLNTMLFASV